MKKGTIERLRVKLGDFIDVQEVLIFNVRYDAKIKNQIFATKQRQEAEKTEASNLRIKETQLQQQVAKSAADAEAAIHALAERKALADAKYYEEMREAEAIELKAKALSENPGLIEYMEAEARKIEAERWDGKRTLTHQVFTYPVTEFK